MFVIYKEEVADREDHPKRDALSPSLPPLNLRKMRFGNARKGAQ